jgi:hypothetical protein
VTSFHVRAEMGSAGVSFGQGRLYEHHLMTGRAQPGFVAAQACDDSTNVGNVAAAQAKHVRLAGFLLREGLADTQRENDQRGANDLACSPVHEFSPYLTTEMRTPT